MKYASGRRKGCRRHISGKDLIEILVELKCFRHACATPGAGNKVRFPRLLGCVRSLHCNRQRFQNYKA